MGIQVSGHEDVSQRLDKDRQPPDPGSKDLHLPRSMIDATIFRRIQDIVSLKISFCLLFGIGMADSGFCGVSAAFHSAEVQNSR
jgi:hypothetical protein